MQKSLMLNHEALMPGTHANTVKTVPTTSLSLTTYSIHRWGFSCAHLWDCVCNSL